MESCMVARKTVGSWIILAAVTAGFILLISQTGLWERSLKYLFPNQSLWLYPGANLWGLMAQHLKLVGLSSLVTVIIGVPLGIWVTRRAGKDILPMVMTATSFGQTFPPVAVLALAVPALGFGFAPTILALSLYGLLPVVRNTVAGINNISSYILEAAQGMGMSPNRILLKIEIPLSARVILAGVRISVTINIGTAMIGATIGAGGLGAPVVAGLVQNNIAYVIEGALPAALLAILVDRILANVEKRYHFPGMTA
jgi:osmoprotectant transport system permease protein